MNHTEGGYIRVPVHRRLCTSAKFKLITLMTEIKLIARRYRDAIDQGYKSNEHHPLALIILAFRKR